MWSIIHCLLLQVMSAGLPDVLEAWSRTPCFWNFRYLGANAFAFVLTACTYCCPGFVVLVGHRGKGEEEEGLGGGKKGGGALCQTTQSSHRQAVWAHNSTVTIRFELQISSVERDTYIIQNIMRINRTRLWLGYTAQLSNAFWGYTHLTADYSGNRCWWKDCKFSRKID